MTLQKRKPYLTHRIKEKELKLLVFLNPEFSDTCHRHRKWIFVFWVFKGILGAYWIDSPLPIKNGGWGPKCECKSDSSASVLHKESFSVSWSTLHPSSKGTSIRFCFVVFLMAIGTVGSAPVLRTECWQTTIPILCAAPAKTYPLVAQPLLLLLAWAAGRLPRYV